MTGEHPSNRKTCPGCFGSGVQQNTQTGLRETCPVCGGTGHWSPRQPAATETWCQTTVKFESANIPLCQELQNKRYNAAMDSIYGGMTFGSSVQ